MAAETGTLSESQQVIDSRIRGKTKGGCLEQLQGWDFGDMSLIPASCIKTFNTSN